MFSPKMVNGKMGFTRRKTVGIVPAAGLGVRMGANRPKQFLEIDGVPILALTLRTIQECDAVDKIIVVAPEEELEFCQRSIVDRYRLEKVMSVIPGGERRQDSVRLGLEASGDAFDLEHGAAIAGLPANETVKQADEQGMVVRTLDRSGIWLIQTPQAFSWAIIHEAHERARREGLPEATDDATLVERLGVPVKIVHGSERNVKVTTPSDLVMVRALLERTA